jgi:hypothetical protein
MRTINLHQPRTQVAAWKNHCAMHPTDRGVQHNLKRPHLPAQRHQDRREDHRV